MILASEVETQQIAQALVPCLQGGDILYLQGDLGAGKTTFSRYLIQAMGHRGAVKSPTYTIVEPYDLAGYTLYHFDLYRIADPEELELIGWREYFRSDAICVIEWPDKACDVLPEPTLVLKFDYCDDVGQRSMVWQGDQARWAGALS